MSTHHWCHGTNCHKSHTQDRVRGSKGSKVLRTRKIKQEIDREWYHPDQVFNYFCSQGCLMDFMRANINRIVAIAPRLEPLETPIDDPKKVKYTGSYVYDDGTRHTWTETEIKEKGVDTQSE